MDNMDKVDKLENDLDILSTCTKEFENNLNYSEKLFNSITDLTTLKRWLNTIGIAIFVYFLTMLFQIKLKESVPYQINALIGIGFVFFSLCVGFYIRLSTELHKRAIKFSDMVISIERLNKTTNDIQNIADAICHDISKDIDTPYLDKLQENLHKITNREIFNKDKLKNFIKIFEYKALNPLIFQMVLLFLGFVCISFYMTRYIMQ